MKEGICSLPYELNTGAVPPSTRICNPSYRHAWRIRSVSREVYTDLIAIENFECGELENNLLLWQ
jgi:hypothetical protein